VVWCNKRKQETHQRWDSERELYDDVVYVLYVSKASNCSFSQ